MNQITKAATKAQLEEVEAQRASPAVPEPKEQTSQVAFASPDGRTKVMALDWPITVDGRTLEAVTIRRLTGHDFRTLTAIEPGSDENAALLGIMTGLAPEVVAGLDADDYGRLSQEARDFLPRALREAAGLTSASGEPMPR